MIVSAEVRLSGLNKSRKLYPMISSNKMELLSCTPHFKNTSIWLIHSLFTVSIEIIPSVSRWTLVFSLRSCSRIRLSGFLVVVTTALIFGVFTVVLGFRLVVNQALVVGVLNSPKEGLASSTSNLTLNRERWTSIHGLEKKTDSSITKKIGNQCKHSRGWSLHIVMALKRWHTNKKLAFINKVVCLH